MITRNQVADIIASALVTSGVTEDFQPHHAQAFAQRLATALDALGLSQFCDISEPDGIPTHEHTDTSQSSGEYHERRDRSADR